MMEQEDFIRPNRRTRWRPRWKPTSKVKLAQAEKRILDYLWEKLERKFVPVNTGKNQWHLRTIAVNKSSSNTPLVLLHGMGAGVGLWALNLESLSSSRPVYAVDMLGFGRSSRPKFSKKADLAEEQFVESLESWRKQMQLEKIVLLGHSLGGFIAAAYALRYPENLHHLVLVDPWGFPEKPPDAFASTNAPKWVKVVAVLVKPFNPLAGLRASGPWGPGLIERLRPDLVHKFDDLYKDDTVANYIYHCNAQTPSGEAAFKSLSDLVWAKYPMLTRVSDIDSFVPITMVHGDISWIDKNIGIQVKELRKDSFVDVKVIDGAGHHVYADQSEAFNRTVVKVCDSVDKHLKDQQTSSPLQQISNV